MLYKKKLKRLGVRCKGSDDLPETEFIWEIIPEEGLYLCCRSCKFEIYYPIGRIRNQTNETAEGAIPGYVLRDFFETITIRRWLTTPHSRIESYLK